MHNEEIKLSILVKTIKLVKKNIVGLENYFKIKINWIYRSYFNFVKKIVFFLSGSLVVRNSLLKWISGVSGDCPCQLSYAQGDKKKKK